MRRSLSGIVLSLLLSVPAAAVEPDSLLVTSVGGPAAVDSLREMTSFTAEGAVTLNGLQGRFTEYFVPPDRSYIRLDLGTFSMVQAYDGRTAWQEDLNGQVSELEGYEKQEILKATYFHSFSYLFPNRIPGSCEFLSDTTLAGRDCRRVAFYPLHTDTITAYYDTRTSLLAMSESRLDDIVIRTEADDYRVVGGVMWPFHTRMVAVGAPLSMEYVYERIVINATVDPYLFDMPRDASRDFRFPGGSDSIVIPFEYRAGHIYVPVVINGKRKTELILDSGSSASIFNRALAIDLDLEVVGSMAAKGLSAYEQVDMVRVDSLAIGALTMYDQVIGTLDMKTVFGARADGRIPGGTLGYDFLSRFPVAVDYRDSLLVIYNPESFTCPEGGSEVEFFLTMKVPTVRARLNGIPGDFIVDLGNAFGLVVHHRFAVANMLTEQLDDVRDTPQSIGGIGGPVSGKSAYAASFRIGDVMVQSLRVLLPDSDQGLAGSEKIAGNVGNLVLENFRVLFDYDNSRLILYETDR